MKHLPATKEEFIHTNWDACDFVFVVGEAYIDHSSFGHAIISRVLENAGFRVGIISLPNYKDPNSFKIFGRPRLAFLVSAGNIDSMVNHYTVAKKKRSTDSYAPNNKAGMRPDRATIVYSNMIRQAYKDVPIIIGGIEVSLRRFAHYDYWDNAIRRSILEDSSANILTYGMGELATIEIAKLLDKGVPISSINNIKGTCTISNTYPDNALVLPSYLDISNDKETFAKCFMQQYNNQDYITGKVLVQKQHRKYVIQNPPQPPLTQSQLDSVYQLPYTRKAHPMYGPKGISALAEVKFSLLSARGCFGSCNFCALSFHQGRNIVSRSHTSLINEATSLTKDKDFKGYIHDVGGPTANFRHPSCKKQSTTGSCTDKMCLYPKPCDNLTIDHKDYLNLLRKLRSINGIKKVFIRSGLRYDYIIADKDGKLFINELCKHHISGRLKIAPEHISAKVLHAMGKPTKEAFFKFRTMYLQANTKLDKQQHLEPYFISSHPGSTLDDAIELAISMKELKILPKQVQDFYPTPSTISTCMYYTGYDPRNMKHIHVPKGEEKKMQRALLQYTDPKNHSLVIKALIRAHREDLIGHDNKCLVAPYKVNKANNKNSASKRPPANKKHNRKR